MVETRWRVSFYGGNGGPRCGAAHQPACQSQAVEAIPPNLRATDKYSYWCTSTRHCEIFSLNVETRGTTWESSWIFVHRNLLWSWIMLREAAEAGVWLVSSLVGQKSLTSGRVLPGGNLIQRWFNPEWGSVNIQYPCEQWRLGFAQEQPENTKIAALTNFVCSNWTRGGDPSQLLPNSKLVVNLTRRRSFDPS